MDATSVKSSRPVSLSLPLWQLFLLLSLCFHPSVSLPEIIRLDISTPRLLRPNDAANLKIQRFILCLLRLETMTHAIVLCALELIAILSCSYGLIFLGNQNNPLPSVVVFSGAWFLLGIVSNVFGLLAQYYMYFGTDTGSIERTSHNFLQYHYMFAWFSIVFGYPMYVIQVWLWHYPTPYAHLHLLLPLLPFLAWAGRHRELLVVLTQTMMLAAIFSHLYISYLADNHWGMFGGMVMILNIVFISLPTSYNFLGFTSKDLYVISLAVTSYLFCLAAAASISRPTHVESLNLLKKLREQTAGAT